LPVHLDFQLASWIARDKKVFQLARPELSGLHDFGRWGEHRGEDPALLQHLFGGVEHVCIAAVESHRHGSVGERRRSPQMRLHLVHRYDIEVVRQILYLFFEVVRLHGELQRVVAQRCDPVVLKDQARIGCSCSVRAMIRRAGRISGREMVH
jgi:hypothetical protein